MKSIDIEQIENYQRGKMTPEERTQFEADLAADPELRRRTDEMRQFAEDIRQIARADIRTRVEAVRDKIKQEEAEQERPPRNPPQGWIKSAIFLAVGILLGLALGRLLFYEEQAPIDSTEAIDKVHPVATPRFEEIARISIPGPESGEEIWLTVSYMPDLDKPNQPARKYALDSGGVGLCIFTRQNDYFWRKPIELSKDGLQFFLKIGEDVFPLKDDGEEYDFPE